MAKKKAAPKPGPATQKHLDIAEIRDDMVIMKDGTVRSVLLVSSINFALKSTEEQEAIIQSYITFLNSLEYPMSIVIQSRRMNIEGYMQRLDEQEKKTTNELLKNQIRDYRTFINELLELGEIMQKRFYVVVPYDPVSDKRQGFMSRLGDALSPAQAKKLNKKQYEDRKLQLGRRTDIISGQLESMGLKVIRLDTQGLIELYYTTYNPDTFDTERMKNVADIRVQENPTAV